MPVAAAGSMPILRNITSMRRLPSFEGTVRSHTRSPDMMATMPADSGSSDPMRLSSGIAWLGSGFHAG